MCEMPRIACRSNTVELFELLAQVFVPVVSFPDITQPSCHAANHCRPLMFMAATMILFRLAYLRPSPVCLNLDAPLVVAELFKKLHMCDCKKIIIKI